MLAKLLCFLSCADSEDTRIAPCTIGALLVGAA